MVDDVTNANRAIGISRIVKLANVTAMPTFATLKRANVSIVAMPRPDFIANNAWTVTTAIRGSASTFRADNVRVRIRKPADIRSPTLATWIRPIMNPFANATRAMPVR